MNLEERVKKIIIIPKMRRNYRKNSNIKYFTRALI